ncbi:MULTISPECIES: amino acid ABC transporter permease [Bacillus cereus group]|uniref:amino acid ABC transporter permease n=1 Tax=Bacillus cereus group TaxID=86661 RepID=UPI0008645CFD|nr:MULTISPECIES: amino acid ABC transporter permease [Bacillus cereus group]AWC27335.1 amino acid ABC transporter permease [Bacillus cytotoxicus]AWC39448.1 amino acid ABC transporter permease [Bacillus cytotoxicus]AWC47379.1 amino acid ABC transporter permease [Bacillus cytotoxicus]AWC51401.1 amino acid ABC transporter permease [Bacillus cytotoxicus]AWC55530.1 amino acid ABC transporter permease [Bacillus cytotoxicus]
MIEIFLSTYPTLLKAVLITLQLTLTSLLLGSLIGLLFAFFRISNNKLLNSIAHIYIAVIRGTPLIVQIAILYFGITSIVVFTPFWAGAIALAIHNGAYITEIFRGSIQSVDRGQIEAARSLGMSYPLAMRRIILPQAFRLSIPPLGNQFIIGLKDSSLVAYVGMSELWGSGLSIAAGNYQQLNTYIVVGIYYLVLVLLFTYFVNLLEKRLSRKQSNTVQINNQKEKVVSI